MDAELLIPGFGHYIFKGLNDNGIDPRIIVVEEAIKTLYPNSITIKITSLLREIFRSGELIKNKKSFLLPPNSDLYWSSFLYDFFSDYGEPFKIAEISSIFIILTRISGLLAHDTEQRQESFSMKIVGWVIDDKTNIDDK